MTVKDILAAGDMRLTLQASKRKGKYTGTFSRDGSPIKLSLEKIEEHKFIESFLNHFHFAQSDKKRNAGSKLLARMGLHSQPPLIMDYADNTYKFKYDVVVDSIAREIQLFYSPLSARLVVRANRR